MLVLMTKRRKLKSGLYNNLIGNDDTVLVSNNSVARCRWTAPGNTSTFNAAVGSTNLNARLNGSIIDSSMSDKCRK